MRDERFVTAFFTACALAALALSLDGCGASALQQHARSCAAASVVVAGAHESIVAACGRQLAECQDEPCVDRVEASCRDAGVARDLAAESVAGYADAVSVVHLAGDDPDAVLVLVSAWQLLVERWAATVRAAGPLGAQLPEFLGGGQ